MGVEEIKVRSSRWHILSACLFTAGVTGLTSAFGLLSNVLQDKLNYSASEVALIASFGNFGSYSGFVSGYVIIALGAGLSIQLASVLMFGSLFCMWLSVTQAIPSTVASLCIYIFLAQIGASTISQGTLSSSVKSFPAGVRSQIASLAKSYYGIAGALLAVISSIFFASNGSAFILFCSLGIPLCTFYGGSQLHPLPSSMISFDFELSKHLMTSLSPYYNHFFILLLTSIVALVLSLSIDMHVVLMVVGGLLVAIFFAINLVPNAYYMVPVVASCHDPSASAGVLHEPLRTHTPHGVRSNSSTSSVFHRDSLTMQYSYPEVDDAMVQTRRNSKVLSADQGRRRLGSTCSGASDRGSYTALPPDLGLASPQVHNTTRSSFIFPRIDEDEVGEDGDEESAGGEAAITREKDIGLDDDETSVQTAMLDDVSVSVTNKDYTMVEMLQTLRCWVVFFVLSTIFGSCLVTINLIDPISVSQGVTIGAPTMVFIINTASAVGRIGVGYITSRFEEHVTMVQFMGITALCVALVNFGIGLYIDVNFVFFLFVFLIGALFGITKVLQAATSVDMFGVTYVATNSGFFGLSGAVGSYVFAYGVIALYPPEAGDCVGADCYQKVFFISSAACLVGGIAAFALDFYLKRLGQ